MEPSTVRKRVEWNRLRWFGADGQFPTAKTAFMGRTSRRLALSIQRAKETIEKSGRCRRFNTPTQASFLWIRDPLPPPPLTTAWQLGAAYGGLLAGVALRHRRHQPTSWSCKRARTSAASIFQMPRASLDKCQSDRKLIV